MSKNTITKVKKRDGTIVDFDQSKKLSDKVTQILSRRFRKDEIPNVEQIQDIVEEVLVLEGLVETAKAYIL